MNEGISIIVCCYNSSELLPITLRHLALLKVPNNTPCELILVNNKSTDNTSDVARQEWSKYETSITLNIVNEFKAGLIFAREKGINSAKYEIIVFCDDDNWFKENYLLVALDTMNKNPTIGALGGNGEAVSNIDLPYWFERVKGSYACGKQWSKSGFCSERMYLWGAGLVCRKSILRRVFERPLRSIGRNGTKLLAGDDAEICMRIILLNYELYYNDALQYKHFMSSFRLEKKYYNKMVEGFQESNGMMYSYMVEIFKMKNKGINRYWAYSRDLILLFLLKMKLIKSPNRFVVNLFRIERTPFKK